MDLGFFETNRLRMLVTRCVMKHLYPRYKLALLQQRHAISETLETDMNTYKQPSNNTIDICNERQLPDLNDEYFTGAQ